MMAGQASWYARSWAGGLALCAAMLSPQVHLQQPVVKAVLFFSPACPHCHQVITQDLPPLMDQYGSRLQLIVVDTTSEAGHELYQAAVQRFSIPEERRGVPMLIVGDTVLVGSLEIPERFPGLVETYLDSGGVGWPSIPGLAETMATAEAAFAETQAGSHTSTPSDSAPESSVAPAPSPTPALAAPAGPQALPGLSALDDPPASPGAPWARDPLGSAVAVAVLIFMLITVGGVTRGVVRGAARPRPALHNVAIPLLCLAGLGVAGYLAYVETTQVEAVCGPIGDCNTVQQSDYARLFGLIPIGSLGVAGYAGIAATWLARRVWRGRPAMLLEWTMFSMCLFGALFSIYLTYLEPFVIGAICSWCLTSAVIISSLLWLAPTPESMQRRATSGV